MPRISAEQDSDTLEAIIDRSTLHDTLEAIAQICRLKSYHLQENWQDDRTARVWVRAATRIETALKSKDIRVL